MNIGIFTIAYNGYGRFLPAWCESIASQTVRPRQVAVGLFGDNHGLSAEDEKRCRAIMNGIDFGIVRYNKHVNIGTDRNKVVKMLNTEWVMLLSVDDVLLPGAIEEFKKHDKSNIGLIGCSYIRENIDGTKSDIDAPDTARLEDAIKWRKFWMPPYSPFRKSLWEDNRYQGHEYPNIPFTVAIIASGAGYERTDIPCVIHKKKNGSHSVGRSKEEQAAIENWLDIYMKYFLGRHNG